MRGRVRRLAVGKERFGLGDRHREHLADVAPAELVLQDVGLEPLPFALLADRGDPGHHRQVRVDHAGAVAVRAGALGVGAEQGGLHAVDLRELLADRVEQPGVRRRVAAPRPLDRGLVDRHDSVSSRHRAGDQWRLLPPTRPRRQRHQHTSGMSTSTSWRLCVLAPRTSSVPVDVRTVSVRRGRRGACR